MKIGCKTSEELRKYTFHVNNALEGLVYRSFFDFFINSIPTNVKTQYMIPPMHTSIISRISRLSATTLSFKVSTTPFIITPAIMNNIPGRITL